MKAKLTIKNPESTSTIIFEDIKDKNFFNCASGDEEYTVDLRDDFNIDLKSKDHTTNVRIKRKVEVIIGQGWNVQEACRQISITEQTYYRWWKEYGGLDVSDAKRLKTLEKENDRLKKLVADLSLDNQILKDVAMGK